MRILHLGTLYPPHMVGGAERSVSLLAEAQAREGHVVAAACISPRGWAEERRNGVDVYRMPHGNDFWMEDWAEQGQRAREWAKFKQQANFGIERRFARVIAEVRPDIVNTHSLVDVSTRVWHAAHKAGVPIVHTLRDYDLVCAASSMYRESGPCTHRHLKCRLLTFAKGLDQRLVSGVSAVGEEVLARHLDMGFFRHVPRDRRDVIWNGVEGHPIAGRRPRAADAPFTFGFLGRISPEKGLDTLLDAARLLPAGGFQLRVAGVAPVGADDMRAKAAGLAVDFLGFVPPAELLGSVDVLVVPSKWAEPLGRSVLEAYRAGVPVIGARSGGIAEIVADDDWLFAPGDVAALAALMRGVLAGGRAALPLPVRFASVVERTRPDTVANAFLRLYARTLRATAKTQARPLIGAAAQ